MKNLLYSLIAVFSVFTFHNSYSQVGQQWVAKYTGGSAYAMTIDASSNVYVTGHFNSGNQGFGTIKYNSSGVQQWASDYRFVLGDNSAYGVAVDDSGNVYVTGPGRDGSNVLRLLTVKYDAFGVQQWTVNSYVRMLPGSLKIAVDPNRNIYICSFGVAGGGATSYEIIKINSSGVVQWSQLYSGLAVSVVTDHSGYFYFTGYSNVNMPNTGFTTFKYDTSDNIKWVSRYSGPANSVNRPTSMAVDNSGSVYVTGYGINAGDSADYVTIKYDSTGNELWVSRYNGTGNSTDVPNGIAVDASGNVFVTGNSIGIGTGRDFATIKYNSAGVQQWVQRYNGPANGDDQSNSVKLDLSGNVYVSGSSMGAGTGYDYVTIKYNQAGVQQWLIRYDSSGSNDYVSSLAVDAAGNVFVSGTSNNDYTTIKYSQLTGINPVSSEIPSIFRLYQNYPNPFNPSTKIKFDIPANSGLMNQTPTRLIIYDAIGREVSILVNELLKAGGYEVEWNAGNYPSGVYFYKLVSGDFSQTKKLILIK